MDFLVRLRRDPLDCLESPAFDIAKYLLDAEDKGIRVTFDYLFVYFTFVDVICGQQRPTDEHQKRRCQKSPKSPSRGPQRGRLKRVLCLLSLELELQTFLLPLSLPGPARVSRGERALDEAHGGKIKVVALGCQQVAPTFKPARRGDQQIVRFACLRPSRGVAL